MSPMWSRFSTCGGFSTRLSMRAESPLPDEILPHGGAQFL